MNIFFQSDKDHIRGKVNCGLNCRHNLFVQSAESRSTRGVGPLARIHPDIIFLQKSSQQAHACHGAAGQKSCRGTLGRVPQQEDVLVHGLGGGSGGRRGEAVGRDVSR